jgi:hypothetical protein
MKIFIMLFAVTFSTSAEARPVIEVDNKLDYLLEKRQVCK